MKKLCSLLFALTLAAALTIPVFADVISPPLPFDLLERVPVGLVAGLTAAAVFVSVVLLILLRGKKKK